MRRQGVLQELPFRALEALRAPPLAHLAPEHLRSAVTRLEGLTSSKPPAEEISASVNA
jgi:hypothetical protein